MSEPKAKVGSQPLNAQNPEDVAPIDQLLADPDQAGDIAPVDQVSDPASDSPPPAPAGKPAEQKPVPWQPNPAEVHLVELKKIPLGPLPDKLIAARRYRISQHVEAGNLSVVQGDALRQLQIGLDLRGDRLANGKRVISEADVLRWLLEQLAS